MRESLINRGYDTNRQFSKQSSGFKSERVHKNYKTVNEVSEKLYKDSERRNQIKKEIENFRFDQQPILNENSQ